VKRCVFQEAYTLQLRAHIENITLPAGTLDVLSQRHDPNKHLDGLPCPVPVAVSCIAHELTRAGASAMQWRVCSHLPDALELRGDAAWRLPVRASGLIAAKLTSIRSAATVLCTNERC
jgi:hypothetical protein